MVAYAALPAMILSLPPPIALAGELVPSALRRPPAIVAYLEAWPIGLFSPAGLSSYENPRIC